MGGNGERICQAQRIKLVTSTYIPFQIDGEPAKLCPSIIEITHKNQASMLEHVKYKWVFRRYIPKGSICLYILIKIEDIYAL